MDHCALQPGSVDHLERIRRHAMERKIPLHGAFDITHRCNLRCIHCYLGSHEKEADRRSGEISTAQALRLLDEMAEAGCLYLLISGGEPLLRADFCEIYRHARSLGMWVTLFTNATLLNQEHLDVLSEYPPYVVEVTLYGATPETYQAVTGIPGSYARCRRAIDLLLKRRIRLVLKTVILKANVHEVPAIEDLARALGTQFRLDGTIIPCIDGALTPLAQRLDPKSVVEIEFADPERLRKHVEYYERMRDLPLPVTLFQCAAGIMAFHIDPAGALRPCFTATGRGFDAVAMGFADAWKAASESVANLFMDQESPCRSCGKRLLCGYCPGVMDIESGSARQPPAFLCEIGAMRLNVIEKTISQGGPDNVIR